MAENNKKKIIVFEDGDAAHVRHEICRVLTESSKRGDTESIKALREMQAQDKFDSLIANADNDEYEFTS